MAPRVLSIASPGNGSGKTRLAATILEAHPGAFSALKFTTVYRDGRNCPRTEVACACRDLHGRYTIISDPTIIEMPDTDTGRLSRAGAARTLWCLALPSAHAEAWRHLTSEFLAPDERLITEGNRAVPILSPEALVVVANPHVPRGRWKSDTWDLIARCDLVVVNDFRAPEETEAGAPSPPALALAREIGARANAPVAVQDVAVPLARWADTTLACRVRAFLAPSRPLLKPRGETAVSSLTERVSAQEGRTAPGAEAHGVSVRPGPG